MLLGGTARRPRAEPERHIERPRRRSTRRASPSGSSGSGPRAIATAARTGGAVFRGSRDDLQRFERAAGATVSGALLGTAVVGARFPRVLAWPLAAAGGLVGASGLARVLRPRSSGEKVS